MDKHTVLRDYFGYSDFRPGQEELIGAILSGRDAFGIMPTGGGKSICYQVPAMLLPGVTFVISPLISLMQDQVTALRQAGVPAAYINSSLSLEQLRTVFSNARAGKYKIVYVAPERLETESFARLADGLRVDLVAVDEAHCISQWGQEFRPSYLKIVDFIKSLRRRPVVAAFTATATEEVRRDVERILELRDPVKIVTGFDRPNLRYEVMRPKQKNTELVRYIRKHGNRSGIVYCATRKKVESVCGLLRECGIAATRYHAGLDEEERRKNQEDFLFDRCTVMVATNAFGMGIDKSNVRYVIHYNMPKSLEAYYQEAGRAGRDGESADCLMLFSAGDIMTARFLIENGSESRELSAEERARILEADLGRLEIMAGYCKTTECYRGYILDYFGQSHPKSCGNCGNCSAVFDNKDITTEAQMILSCIKRIETKLDYNVGATLLMDTLRGGHTDKIRALRLDKLSTYGLMRNDKPQEIKLYIDRLEELGYIYTDKKYKALHLTDKAGAVLFRGEKVIFKRKKEAPAKKKKQKSITAQPEIHDTFEELRALRRRIADEEGMPAFVVFTDAARRDMAEKMPVTEAEFLEVSGVGLAKLQKYGKVFLKKIRELVAGRCDGDQNTDS